MNVIWSAASGEFELHRYPKGQHDKSLQAWDSADELLVEHCQQAVPQDESILILNDMFGALSVGLNQFERTVVTDSEISKRAIIQNCEANNLAAPAVLDSLEPWPECQTVLLKLTKNIGYLEFQLRQIAQLSHSVGVIATGKTTLVTSSVLRLFEKYLRDVTTSFAKKKSRLIFAQHTSPQTLDVKYPTCVKWPEKRLTLLAHANVFCKDQIDIGGRFLADNLPGFTPGQTVIDLGCGNGLLGLCALRASQNNGTRLNLVFCDESFMAVESARLNVEANFADSLGNCQFIQDDCLSTLESGSADIILCNPPFHQQNTITEYIAEQMFYDAKRVLKKGGELYVVANRHLPYQKALKKHFGGFSLATQNNKFVIYRCHKRK